MKKTLQRTASPLKPAPTFPWRVTGGKSRFSDKQIKDAMVPIILELRGRTKR
jgi:hypothetical protein